MNHRKDSSGSCIMWKTLIIYLSFEFISGNYHDPIYPVQNPCLAILDRLSETSSTFLNCAISRARPFKLCEGCVDHYARLHDLIDLLDSTYSDSGKKVTCKSFLESFDSIQVVAQLISFVENIWKSSFCDNCFAGYNDVNGTVSYTLADITKTFLQKKIQFDLCIFNATGHMIPIIPVDFNVTSNTSVCTLCSTAYHEINDFFLQITQGNKPSVCMDIVDTMNYTRLLWSKTYACRRHDPDYLAIMGISLFIPTIVLVFYVSALFKGERQQKKLSQQKRLTPQSTTAALAGTRTWLWSTPNA